MAANFSTQDKFDREKAFMRILFGDDAYLMEVELNEMQKIMNDRIFTLIKAVATNGFVNRPALVLTGNTLTLPIDTFIVDGIMFDMIEPMIISVSNGDTVYLSVWETTVDYTMTIKRGGNLSGGSNITDNGIFDARAGEETSRRIQLQLQLTKVNNDPNKKYLPVASINDGVITDLRPVAKIRLPLKDHGAGSGLDADLLRGMQPSTSASANTIVQRDGSGRIKAAAPSASDDVARKAELDSVIDSLNTHTGRADNPHLTTADQVGAPRLTRTVPDGVSLNTVVTSGFYRLSGSHPDAPPSTGHGQMIVSRGGDTVFQIVTGFNHSHFYMRHGNPPEAGGSGVWQPWRQLWHDGNDGAGSGLDADLLDGRQPSTSASANTIVQRDSSGRIKAAAPSASDDVARKAEVDATISGKEIPGNDANNAIKTGYYYFNPSTLNGPGFQYGIIHTMVSYGDTHNGTDNWVFQVAYATGYNAIKVRRKINADPWSDWSWVWTSESDGPGSGLDADTVDGYQASQLVRSANNHQVFLRWDTDGVLHVDVDSSQDLAVARARYATYLGDFHAYEYVRKAEIDTRLQNNISFRINSGVVEYYNGSGWVPVAGLKSVQRGTASLPSNKTVSVTISPVNPSKAFVNLNVFGTPGNRYISLKLENSTTLIFTQEGGSVATPSIEWEVVEFY